ncbi:unnamed protein product [Cyprideis torosa]|uniref:EB domain-containing protein n=1 Tax=Cyprideis torosa TaxID=163714 RepID=A0A7R8WMQ7_9CRUS|nr:unnamed protein product [Cyprideis torosa]CAG0903933.1 unnamed protein product [Cyprideis torosa]
MDLGFAFAISFVILTSAFREYQAAMYGEACAADADCTDPNTVCLIGICDCTMGYSYNGTYNGTDNGTDNETYNGTYNGTYDGTYNGSYSGTVCAPVTCSSDTNFVMDSLELIWDGNVEYGAIQKFVCPFGENFTTWLETSAPQPLLMTNATAKTIEITATCQANGTWTNRPSECAALTCGDPPTNSATRDPKNPNSTWTSTYVDTCLPGFYYNGSVRTVIGQWVDLVSPYTATCYDPEVDTCPGLPIAGEHMINTTITDPIVYDTKWEWKCEDGWIRHSDWYSQNVFSFVCDMDRGWMERDISWNTRHTLQEPVACNIAACTKGLYDDVHDRTQTPGSVDIEPFQRADGQIGRYTCNPRELISNHTITQYHYCSVNANRTWVRVDGKPSEPCLNRAQNIEGLYSCRIDAKLKSSELSHIFRAKSKITCAAACVTRIKAMNGASISFSIQKKSAAVANSEDGLECRCGKGNGYTSHGQVEENPDYSFCFDNNV